VYGHWTELISYFIFVKKIVKKFKELKNQGAFYYNKRLSEPVYF